jgi:hypothetical protein
MRLSRRALTHEEISRKRISSALCLPRLLTSSRGILTQLSHFSSQCREFVILCRDAVLGVGQLGSQECVLRLGFVESGTIARVCEGSQWISHR